MALGNKTLLDDFVQEAPMRASILLALVAAACGGTTFTSSQFGATLAGANETPPNTSPGTGTATFTLTGTIVSYTISYANLTGSPTGSHIHVGASGVKGGIVVPFSGVPSGASGTWTGSFTFSDVAAGTSGSTVVGSGNLDDVLNAMRSGNAYTNIHTAANPGGEIRGQIQPK
jgi:hypothetical protein